VQVQAGDATVQIFAGDQRVAIHPKATHPGQRFTTPGQWKGLESGQERPRREALAVQVPTLEVEQRSLQIYDALVGSGR
jgi:hypothetical protein